MSSAITGSTLLISSHVYIIFLLYVNQRNQERKNVPAAPRKVRSAFFIYTHSKDFCKKFFYSLRPPLSAFANFVYSGIHASFTVPIGPFLCFATMISAIPLFSDESLL